MTDISAQIAAQESAKRVELHKDDKSIVNAPYSHEIGLRGELEFAQMFNVCPNLKLKRRGDSGIDFVIPLQFSIDVKTAKYRELGNDLLVTVRNDEGRSKPDIYVLYVLSQDESYLECRGWQWRTFVEKQRSYDTGRGLINYVVWAKDLKPISELEKRKLSFSLGE